MEDKEKAGIALMCVGVIGIGAFAIIKSKTSKSELPTDAVRITLKNKPSGSDRWTFEVIGYNMDGIISDDNIPAGESAQITGIPESWYPLKVDVQIEKFVDSDTVTVLHYIQSYNPAYVGYYELFIPAPGEYYYDVEKRIFTKN